MIPAASYDPDMLSLLTDAFNDAWKDLQALMGAKPVATDVLRTRLAAAADGERNPKRLRLIALGAIDA